MRRKKSEDQGFNIWRSYSDMMAGVLLLFVLLMCVTLFQAQKSYNESIQERDEKLAMQKELTLEILAQQSALEEKEGQLEEQSAQLKLQDENLEELKQTLEDLALQLNEQKASLDEKTMLLADQQAQIDQIIGVKAEVIESLRKEFANNNVSVDIDTQTGALTLDANVMFEYDEAELTEEGMQALREVLPIYCKVLLEETHLPYLAEIIIDGYTDTDGDYGYNLELSQQRSLAVAQYLLDIQDEFLTDSEITSLESYLTVNGHSMANPILDASGNVDKDASRRVEVKFRLKDDEMIEQLSQIMAEAEAEAAASDENTESAASSDVQEGGENNNGE